MEIKEKREDTELLINRKVEEEEEEEHKDRREKWIKIEIAKTDMRKKGSGSDFIKTEGEKKKKIGKTEWQE